MLTSMIQFAETARWEESWFVEAFVMQGVWPARETMVRVAGAKRVSSD